MEEYHKLITRDFLGLTKTKVDKRPEWRFPDGDVPASTCLTLPLAHGKDSYGALGSVTALRNPTFAGMILRPWSQDVTLTAQLANFRSKFKQPVMPGLGFCISTGTGIDNLFPAKDHNQQQSPASHLCCFALDNTQSGTQEAKEREDGAELTIFYNGSVHVYNGISVDQASAIVNFTSNGNPVQNICLDKSTKLHNLDEEVHAAKNTQHAAVKVKFLSSPMLCPECQPIVPTALPLARKASLARFLEKRRERMQMKSPYLISPLAPADRFSSSNYVLPSCKNSINMKTAVALGLEDVAEYLPNNDINRS